MRIWAQEFQKFWKQMHAIYGWHKVEIRLNQKRIFWDVEPCCPLDRYWFYQGTTCFLYVENKPHGQNKKVKKKKYTDTHQGCCWFSTKLLTWKGFDRSWFRKKNTTKITEITVLFSTLKREAVGSSETGITQISQWRINEILYHIMTQTQYWEYFQCICH